MTDNDPMTGCQTRVCILCRNTEKLIVKRLTRLVTTGTSGVSKIYVCMYSWQSVLPKFIPHMARQFEGYQKKMPTNYSQKFLSSSNCLNNICVCMCVHISKVQAHVYTRVHVLIQGQDFQHIL